MLGSLLLLLLIVNSSLPSASLEVVTVRSGETVQLSADLTEAEWKRLHDLKWYRADERLSMINNMSESVSGCYEVLANGSLLLSRAETPDSGKYMMRAFDKEGKRIKTKEILLQVNIGRSRPCTASAQVNCNSV